MQQVLLIPLGHGMGKFHSILGGTSKMTGAIGGICLYGVCFHCRSYQRIFIDCKRIRAFKDANDKRNYNPNSKK